MRTMLLQVWPLRGLERLCGKRSFITDAPAAKNAECQAYKSGYLMEEANTPMQKIYYINGKE